MKPIQSDLQKPIIWPKNKKRHLGFHKWRRLKNQGFVSKFKAAYYDFIFSIIYNKLLYGKLAKIYDTLLSSSTSSNEAWTRILQNTDTGTFLDVACGTGALLAQVRKKGLECYGIDYSQGMLNQARARVPSAKVKKGDFTAIPYPDNM